MQQEVNGPTGGEKWSQHIQILTLIHRLINRSVIHGRYQRSVRFHLLENTVDIDCQFDYTYQELRSIVDC